MSLNPVGALTGLIGLGGGGSSGGGSNQMQQAQLVNPAQVWSGFPTGSTSTDAAQAMMAEQSLPAAYGSAADPTGQSTPKAGGGTPAGMNDGSWSGWNG